LGRSERIVTVRALAVENRDLLEPKKFARLARLSDSNFRTGCATISGRTHQTNANPILRRQIVTIDFHQTMRIERTGVADDVQVPVAIDVSEAKPIVHRGSRLVFDPPGFVHVGEVATADAAQQPQKIAPIPDDVGDTVVVEVSNDPQTPRDVA